MTLMKRLSLTLVAIACVAPLFAQAPAKDSNIQTVTVASKGQDVRDVLSDVFTQTGKSFVIQPNIHFVLFLSLKNVEFEEALSLICKTAGLKYDLQNGIYFVSRDKAPTPATAPAPANNIPTTSTATPSGKLSPKALAKKVSVRLKKALLKDLFAELATQSGVSIEVDPKVPAYRADVVLKDVTLKYALMTICRVANLTYRFTDHQSLEIVPREDPNQPVVLLDPH